jgi:Fic family protein
MVKQVLAHIEQLKKQLSELQPLSAESQQRLDKKFRLEWNYNSNHMEGNTLTYDETTLLLIFDQTKGNHELREYEEMKGHDVALKLVYDLVEDKERTLNENFIRQLNTLLLVRPFFKEAITPDGQPTRREIKVGEYKSFPNSVRLQNGEIFHYPSPAETPALMGDLIEWYKNNSNDAVIVAADLHYKFVCIHPFDDGNGRIARLLMNFHLLKNNLPPVVIKSEDKKNYLRALQEADAGDLDSIRNYVAEKLVWSLELSIKAAKGGNIDELGDWDKKLDLLKKGLKGNDILEQILTNEIGRKTTSIVIE